MMKKLLRLSLFFVPMALAILLDTQATAETYTTDFPLLENPVSEGGKWTNGKRDGLSWADVRTRPGLAFGTESGSVKFDDSTALLTGSWGPDQTVEAAVFNTVSAGTGCCQEVEVRLRSSLSARNCTGYEVLFSANSSHGYIQIVRWNGPHGKFEYIAEGTGHVNHGDVVKATITGTKTVTITAYINGTKVLQGTDTSTRRWATGNPGIGFYLQTNGSNKTFGFTRYMATDELPIQSEPALPIGAIRGQ